MRSDPPAMSGRYQDEGDTDEPTMRASEALGELRAARTERDQGPVLIQADRITELTEVAHRRLTMLVETIRPVLDAEDERPSDPMHRPPDAPRSPLGDQLAAGANDLERLLDRMDRIMGEVEL